MLDKLLRISPWPRPKTRTKQIDLSFALPAFEKSDAAAMLTGKTLARRFDALKDVPIEQLKLMRSEIRALNRRRLGPGDRLALSRDALTIVYPLLLTELRKYAKTGGIPDPQLRRETLDHIIEILRLFGHAYLAVFKHHYDAPDAHFERHREDARQSACRFLELTRLEQRARGLRYLRLSENGWYLANTVFHIMRAYDNVDTPILELDSDMTTGRGTRETTLDTVYCALHVTSHLDMLRWPVASQTLLAGYLAATRNAVVTLADQGEAMHREQLVSHCHDDHPAQPNRKNDARPYTGAIIDWAPLARQLRHDCLAILKACRTGDAGQIPRKFQTLSNIEKLALAQLLLRSMETRPADVDILEREEQVAGMRLYVGFRETHQLVGHILASKGSGDAGKRFVDLFAERSAAIAEDHNTVTESRWHILHQDNKRIRLKTQETQFTCHMEVGSLLAYGLDERDIRRPRLAVVSRLYRPNAISVVIDLDRLAKYAEPVTVMRDEPSKAEPEAMHALLIHDPNLGWNLLFPPQYGLSDTLPVVLNFRNREYRFPLGGLRYVTTDFYLFNIPLDTSALGLDKIPTFPAPLPAEPG